MAEWSAVVTLNGQDVSGRLVGRISIEAEESTSRVSSFTMLPLSGLIQAGDWIGAPATIDYILDPNGSPVQTRLFTGNVNKSVFDPTSGFVSFECTDNLQGHFENMTEAQILSAIVDGKYAIEIFGEREDGWQQAVDVLSTVGKGYDLDRDGVTASLTDWEAKVTSDYSYNDSTVIDASVETDLIRLRDLVNTVNITAEYRFTRLHHRQHNFTWAAKIGLNSGFDFCDYFANSYELPTRDMIQGAGAAGWAIKNEFIDFETLPVTGSYNCGGTVGWSISEELLNQLVVDAEWTVVRRWSQTITESYSITIQDAGSVNQHGTLIYEDGAGWQTDFDDSGWDSSTGTDIPAGWNQNIIGDYTEDQIDRTNSDNVTLTLIQIGKTRICQSHRQNFVSWEIDLEPDIERSHTAEIASNTVTAKGKVFQYIHIMDIDAGSATSNIKIAVSKTWDGGSDGSLFPPTPPDTEPSHTPPSSGTSLDNRIGNDDTAPVFDEEWTGFTGNFTVAQGSPSEVQQYPRRFRVVTSDIEDESRDEVSVNQPKTYDIKCPQDILLLTIGLGPGEAILTSNGSSQVTGVAVGDITIDSVFTSSGVSEIFANGLSGQVIEGVGSASGVAVVAGVGFAAGIISAVASSDGAAVVSGVGSDSIEESVMSSAGISSTSIIGAQINEASFSSNGIGVLLGASPQTYEEVILSDSPVSYWRLGEASGTTASDVQGINDGSYVNTPTLGVTGAIVGDTDTAITLNGTDEYVSIPDDNSLDITGDFTLECWVNFTTTDTNTPMIAKWGTAGSTTYVLTPDFTTAGEITFRISISASFYTVTSNGTLNDGDWHHIVTLYDTTAQEVRMYVDGVEQTVKETGVTGTIDVTTVNMILGNYSTLSAFNYYDGSIDEVAVYDKTLSNAEILAHYNEGINV